jgi:competence protein ComFC
VHALADVLYPEACLSCGRLTRGGFCAGCLRRLPPPGPEVCRRCGAACRAPVPSCRDCRGRAVAFDRALQSVEFRGPARRAVLLLKYRGQYALAPTLALRIGEAARELGAEAVTWVPMSPKRLSARGFDHGRLLAEASAEILGLPSSCLLTRIRDAPPQVGLEPDVRRRNLEGAFQAVLPPPRVVLLVDDVYTTGATASEAARALKAFGARTVYSVSFARSSWRGVDPSAGQTYNRASSWR